jgi:23S rRNA (uracil1939-C5)-methyltransferase
MAVLKTGDVVETFIETVAFGGAGVGRVQGMVVFAPFTVTGDEVELEIREVRKKFALGRVRKILNPSGFRIAPACRYFGRCGGCQLQHMTYEHQLEIKEKHVRDIFERIGKFSSPPVREIIPSPRRFHYRGKADYHIRGQGKGTMETGFMHAAENSVLDIERCELMEESINRSYRALREALLQGRRKVTNERQTIWSAPEGEGDPDWDNYETPSWVMRTVKDRHLLVPYGGFFQINNSLVEALVDQVIGLCALTGVETVLDGYCGAGLFSLFLASHARSISGVEINGDAVHCAGVNLRDAGFSRAVFFQGDLGAIMKERFLQRGMTADVVVLDPPRSGCRREVLDAMTGIKAEKIVYISCNPSTQARDIRYLANPFVIQVG